LSTATQKTAEVHFVSGDATGEPEFDVPFTVTCE
jgi:hypothetical protein